MPRQDLTRSPSGRHRRQSKTGRLTVLSFRDLGGPRSIVALVVAAAGLAGAVVVAIGRAGLLPARFSLDARFIQSLARSGRVTGVDRSFSDTADLYRLLGVENAPLVVAIGTLLLLVLIAGGALFRLPRPIPISAGAIAALSLLLGSVYLCTYSKDAPVLLVTAALVFGRKGWRSEVSILLAIVLYAWMFRSYWFFVLVLYVGFRVVHRIWPRWWVWIIGAVVAISAISLGFFFVLHVPPDHFRSAVNAGRLDDVDARTMIRPFVSGLQPLAGLANVLLAFLALFVPVPLALMGGLYYIGVFAVIVAIWAFFWARVVAAPRSVGSESGRRIALIVAFVTVQAFFEPDFGSALRHLTPLLPVLICLASIQLGWSRSVKRANETSRDARVEAVGLAAPDDNRTGSDDSAFPDVHSGEEQSPRTDPDPVADANGRSGRGARTSLGSSQVMGAGQDHHLRTDLHSGPDGHGGGVVDEDAVIEEGSAADRDPATPVMATRGDGGLLHIESQTGERTPAQRSG